MRTRIFIVSLFSILLLPQTHCMDEKETTLTVINQLTQQVAELAGQLNQMIVNLENHVKFTNTLTPIGAIMEYSGAANVPNNWLECNGDSKRQDQYNELFQVIQDTYAPTGIINVDGNAFSTFKLPDRRGYVAVGIDSNNSTGGRITNATALNIALGQTFGEEVHSLTIQEMPAHDHGFRNRAGLADKGTSPNGHGLANDGKDIITTKTGENLPHNNMQPSMFMKFYIRAK